MDENRVYKIDFENIEKDFMFKKDDLTHSHCNKFKLLPYTTTKNAIVLNFDGVVGAFSRIMCNKQMKEEFNSDDFIDNAAKEISEFEGTGSKKTFKNIVRTMFIDKDEKLVNFNIKTINYISSSYSDNKVAKFLYSVLFDEELKEAVKKHYEADVDNILYKIVLKALPKLEEKNNDTDEYECYLPFVKELFIKDFKFLLKDEELYKNSIERFLEFYYLFYVSQLAIKLNEFEKAEVNSPSKLYFSLGWESISKNRIAYTYGWEKLRPCAEKLFSHAITLEFLNHSNIDKQLNYKDLFEIFSEANYETIENDIEKLYGEYKERRQEGINWEKFAVKRNSSGNKAFDKVYKLCEAIEYQFNGNASKRKNLKKNYINWFIKFFKENFGKKRGSLGYSLSLSEEDIILLTKICINNNDRLKLNVLLSEFEKRGIFFDRDSQIKIIQLYEKLNLLEKKSDSGDAQYVRSIL